VCVCCRRREDSITGMFKKPKIMVEWQFVWKTVPHTITVTHSVFRGKKTIVIDGKERYKGKTFGGGDVSMPFLVDSANDVMTAAEVAIIFKGMYMMCSGEVGSVGSVSAVNVSLSWPTRVSSMHTLR
jgi:hypothetical protein